MAKQLIMTAEQMKDREHWLNTRNKFIGGSDAAVVVGLNEYKSPFELWMEKTGQAEQEDLSNNLRVKFGTYAEEFVAHLFCEETGKKTRRTGLYVNDKYPWACASLDRMIVGEDTFLECKTTASWNSGDWKEDDIPNSYFCQLIHYMTVMEMERCYIACLIGNGQFVWKEVVLNQNDSEALMDAEKDFWFKVQNNIMPKLDGTESCKAALAEKYKGGQISPVMLPNNVLDIVDSLDELKKAQAGIQSVITEKENSLREILGNNEVGLIGERKITWKTQAGRTTIDSKKLKAEQPNIFNQYSKVGNPIRVLKY